MAGNDLDMETLGLAPVEVVDANEGFVRADLVDNGWPNPQARIIRGSNVIQAVGITDTDGMRHVLLRIGDDMHPSKALSLERDDAARLADMLTRLAAWTSDETPNVLTTYDGSLQRPVDSDGGKGTTR